MPLTSKEKTLFGHPIGLPILFLTEMWERFSFYGMRVLLVFYLTEHFLFPDREAVLIFGSYVALTGIAPILGGIVADRYIGHRKAVILGATLLTLGHFCMAFEGTPATAVINSDDVLFIERDMLSLQVLYFSLALIVVGVGFLKANITALVSFLYTGDDPRRDSGFTLFQMGISTGAMVAAIVCGYLGQTFGWKYGFGIAGIGMAAGLIIFLCGQKYIVSPSNHATEHATTVPFTKQIARDGPIYGTTIVAVLIVFGLLKAPNIVGIILGVLTISIVGGMTYFIIYKCDRIERDRISAILAFLGMVIMFFVLIEQAGTSLPLFADRNVDLTFFNVEMRASQTFSFIPAFIILFAPLIAWLWIALSRHNLNPRTPTKCGIGMILTTLGFAVLAFGASMSADGMVPLAWLIVTMLFFALGDLFIAPIALSIITQLSGPKMAGMMVGAYLLAVAAGSYIAALFAQIGVSSELVVEKLPAQVSLERFTTLFLILVVVGIISGIVIFMISPVLRKKMHGLH